MIIEGVGSGSSAALPDVGRLAARFADSEAVIVIIGLGYVGLPLALCACVAGFRGVGFDTDAERLTGLNTGRSPLRHIVNARIAAARSAERFVATPDPARLTAADAVLICVPTPLGPHREPDLSFVEGAARVSPARCARVTSSYSNRQLSRHHPGDGEADSRSLGACDRAPISFWPIRPNATIRAKRSSIPRNSEDRRWRLRRGVATCLGRRAS